MRRAAHTSFAIPFAAAFLAASAHATAAALEPGRGPPEIDLSPRLEARQQSDLERATSLEAAKAARERAEVEAYARYLRDLDRERRINESGVGVGHGWRVSVEGDVKEPRIVLRRNMD